MNHIHIQWPDGAGDGRLITESHDVYMVAQYFDLIGVASFVVHVQHFHITPQILLNMI